MREGLVGGPDGERRSEERCSETRDTVHEGFLLIRSSHGQQAYWDELSFKEPAAVLKPIKSRLTSKAPATTIIPARGLNAMRRTPCPPSLTRGWSLRMTISASLGMALVLNGGRC